MTLYGIRWLKRAWRDTFHTPIGIGSVVLAVVTLVLSFAVAEGVQGAEKNPIHPVEVLSGVVAATSVFLVGFGFQLLMAPARLEREASLERRAWHEAWYRLAAGYPVVLAARESPATDVVANDVRVLVEEGLALAVGQDGAGDEVRQWLASVERFLNGPDLLADDVALAYEPIGGSDALARVRVAIDRLVGTTVQRLNRFESAQRPTQSPLERLLQLRSDARDLADDLPATVALVATAEVVDRYDRFVSAVRSLVTEEFPSRLPMLEKALIEPSREPRTVTEPNILDPSVSREVTVPAADPRRALTDRLRAILDRILSEDAAPSSRNSR